MNKFLSSKLFLSLMLITTTFCYAAKQQDLKQRLFKRANELFTQAKSEQADLLSPSLYSKAVAKNEEAQHDFEKGKSIEKKLIEIETLLQQTLENAKLAKVTFPHLLIAREDALKANAPQYALDSYENAEKEFLDASKAIEKGDIKKAKQKAIKAEKAFRESELLAIKSSIIGNVKDLLDQAKKEDVEKYAPQTIAKASTLLSEAENILNSNREAKTEAREKAEQAVYEVKHAIFLSTNIKELKENDKNWEKLILEHEQYLARIIKELDFMPRFDEGFEKPTSSGLAAIKNLKNENKRLNKETLEQSEEINKLNVELNSIKEKHAGLKTKLDLTRQKEEKYNKIERIFTKQEALVIRENDDVTLRLVGLNFPSGKSIINPEYFSLLSKVQRAIQIFPDYHVIVEGHTDSRGDDRYNERLSMDRANAVRKYLIANMGLSEGQITAIGYGESKPIASNDTAAGRKKNRRIDIVLSPKVK